MWSMRHREADADGGLGVGTGCSSRHAPSGTFTVQPQLGPQQGGHRRVQPTGELVQVGSRPAGCRWRRAAAATAGGGRRLGAPARRSPASLGQSAAASRRRPRRAARVPAAAPPSGRRRSEPSCRRWPSRRRLRASPAAAGRVAGSSRSARVGGHGRRRGRGSRSWPPEKQSLDGGMDRTLDGRTSARTSGRRAATPARAGGCRSGPRPGPRWELPLDVGGGVAGGAALDGGGRRAAAGAAAWAPPAGPCAVRPACGARIEQLRDEPRRCADGLGQAGGGRCRERAPPTRGTARRRTGCGAVAPRRLVGRDRRAPRGRAARHGRGPGVGFAAVGIDGARGCTRGWAAAMAGAPGRRRTRDRRCAATRGGGCGGGPTAAAVSRPDRPAVRSRPARRALHGGARSVVGLGAGVTGASWVARPRDRPVAAGRLGPRLDGGAGAGAAGRVRRLGRALRRGRRDRHRARRAGREPVRGRQRPGACAGPARAPSGCSTAVADGLGPRGLRTGTGAGLARRRWTGEAAARPPGRVEARGRAPSGRGRRSRLSTAGGAGPDSAPRRGRRRRGGSGGALHRPAPRQCSGSDRLRALPAWAGAAGAPRRRRGGRRHGGAAGALRGRSRRCAARTVRVPARRPACAATAAARAGSVDATARGAAGRGPSTRPAGASRLDVVAERLEEAGSWRVSERRAEGVQVAGATRRSCVVRWSGGASATRHAAGGRRRSAGRSAPSTASGSARARAPRPPHRGSPRSAPRVLSRAMRSTYSRRSGCSRSRISSRDQPKW